MPTCASCYIGRGAPLRLRPPNGRSDMNPVRKSVRAVTAGSRVGFWVDSDTGVLIGDGDGSGAQAFDFRALDLCRAASSINCLNSSPRLTAALKIVARVTFERPFSTFE